MIGQQWLLKLLFTEEFFLEENIDDVFIKRSGKGQEKVRKKSGKNDLKKWNQPCTSKIDILKLFDLDCKQE